MGDVAQINIAQNTTWKVFTFSDLKAGLKAITGSQFNRQHFRVGTEKREIKTPVKKVLRSPSIKRTQFLLAQAWASTTHKVQGLSLDQGAVDSYLKKQKSFGPGTIYMHSVK